MLSQSYHWTFSNKYEVRTRQYNGNYVTKNKKKKRLDDEFEQEGHKHTHTYIKKKVMTNRWLWILPPRHRSVLEQCFECYKWILFSSVHLHKQFQSFCAFLSRREYKWLTEDEAKEQNLRCQFYSVLLPVLQSDPMKRRTFGPMKLQTGRQWAKVSSCPLRTTNIHSLSFLHVSPLSLVSAPQLCPPSGPWLSLGGASTSLGVLAGGALRLGGRGGPRVSFWRNEKKYLWSTVFILYGISK